MALACVLDASAAVRLILADPAAADPAERERWGRAGAGSGADAHRAGQHSLETPAGRSAQRSRPSGAAGRGLGARLPPEPSGLRLSLSGPGPAGSGQPDQQRSASECPGRNGVALSPGDTSGRPHLPLELLQHAIELVAERQDQRRDSGTAQKLPSPPIFCILTLGRITTRIIVKQSYTDPDKRTFK